MRVPWNDKGMSLLEVVVAMGILGLVLFAALMAAGTSAGISRTSKLRTRATALAGSFLEVLSSSSPTEVAAYNNLDTARPASYPAGQPARDNCTRWKESIVQELGPQAFGTARVEADTPAAGRTRISITVFWSTSRGMSESQLVEVR